MSIHIYKQISIHTFISPEFRYFYILPFYLNNYTTIGIPPFRPLNFSLCIYCSIIWTYINICIHTYIYTHIYMYPTRCNPPSIYKYELSIYICLYVYVFKYSTIGIRPLNFSLCIYCSVSTYD
jgi:hypothetical protein